MSRFSAEAALHRAILSEIGDRIVAADRGATVLEDGIYRKRRFGKNSQEYRLGRGTKKRQHVGAPDGFLLDKHRIPAGHYMLARS